MPLSWVRTIMDRSRLALVALATLGAPLLVATEAAAHVRYVTDSDGEAIPLVTFLAEVLGDPVNAALVTGGGLLALGAAVGYLRFRPAKWEVAAARETLREYTDLVPWLLRLAVGLPLVGAGFEGYFFTPEVAIGFRLFKVTIGFMLVFGLATRLAAVVGLLAYLAGLAYTPDLLLASEYVGGLLAVLVLGSGRPSADQVLGRIVAVELTRARTVGAIHRPIHWLDRLARPYEELAPTLVRFGLGFNFVYLGFYEKIVHAGRALEVVDQYDLTSVVPVDPGMWVLGAGLVEVALGLALIVGFFTRASASVAFAMFTLTLFALPNDPVLAHVSLFGMVSVLLITGSGPFALDNRLAGQYPEIETSVAGK